MPCACSHVCQAVRRLSLHSDVWFWQAARERVLIWCDMALTADHVRAGYGGINVESNLPSVVVTCKAMVDVKKPNLYDLFTFNAKARGVITDNPDEADIRFGLDDNCDVKPSDIDVIVGKYL